MRVPTEREIEAGLREIAQAIRRMHEHDANAIGSRKRLLGIGRTGVNVIEATNPNVAKRRRKLTVLIDQDLHAGCLQVARNHGAIRPAIMITEDGKPSQRRRNLTQARRQGGDMPRVERNEITTKQQDIGARGFECATRGLKHCRMGRGTGMEISRKCEAEWGDVRGTV